MMPTSKDCTTIEMPPPSRLPRGFGAARIAFLTAALAALFGLTAGARAASPAVAENATPPVSDSTVLAAIGTEHLTERDVIDQDKDGFNKLQADYELKVRQLQIAQAQARHELLEQRLEQILDKRALALEAKAQGTSDESVLADIKTPAVTDEEIRAFYEAHKLQLDKSFDEMQAEIRPYLAHQHETDATRKFYDGLRERYQITTLLAPYRVAVAADGPSRGQADAAVTIVEFADFQCPFCRQAEVTLRALLSRHPNDVRLVFRQLPLKSLHPNAVAAAAAAVCADHQGMFWQMHDAMFADQSALSVPALQGTAKRLGLDMERFSTCLSDSATRALIKQDLNAANEMNIIVTPYFLIDGRPLSGSVPEEQFESIIADELQRLKGGHHVARIAAD
jgi:protein-disulfide isomerase